MVTVRPEQPGDVAAIDRVHASAFDDPNVVTLVHALRASDWYVPEFALVAEIDGEVVGHIMLTRVPVGSESILVLSPLGVHASQHRRGAGAALTVEAVRRADDAGEALIVLTGVPAFYPRFGFQRAGPLGLLLNGKVIDEPWWMARRLSAFDPARHVGDVRWTEPFLALEP